MSARQDDSRRAAVVLDSPTMSIKEISVPVYAIRLARAGYSVLTFELAHIASDVLNAARPPSSP